ncbi:unnamed protein product, partial [Prunus brigantina]
WKIVEQHWKQRSRITWLSAGDMNTKFFHFSTIQRRQKNKIVKLRLDEHQWLEQEHQIRNEFESYFENLFKSNGSRDWSEVLSCVPSLVSPEMNEHLVSPISEEEVVSPFQNAFVANKQIQDNILIAHEAFHRLKLKKKGKNYQLGIKLDMNKAFDRIEWDFLEGVLLKMGFCRKWTSLIMGCLSSVRFSVVLNGKKGRFFKPSRGLRQGDPLSPYLFILVNDALSHLISAECAKGSLHGIRLCNGSPTLSHLLFADDTLLFTKASFANCSRLTHILDAYCAASGQLINLDKSNMYFSPNTPDHIKRSVCSVLKIKAADNPGKYLGMPFLEAEKGGRASWAWNSLLDGRDVILSGARWQIMGGNSVKLWEDSWLPSSNHGYLRHIALVPSTGPRMVADIIDWDHKTWNLEDIENLISVAEANEILSLPIGGKDTLDRLIWPHTMNGSYSVKSGYHWIIGNIMRAQPNRIESSHQVDKQVWKSIWECKTLPKIKLFMWRAIHGIIPTFASLFKKKLCPSPLCPLCLVFPESVEHVIFLCPWARKVWFASNLSFRPNDQAFSSLDRWILAISCCSVFSSLEK